MPEDKTYTNPSEDEIAKALRLYEEISSKSYGYSSFISHAMGSCDPTPVKPVMQWVKASERLPDSKRYYNCTVQGLPVVYWIDKGNNSIVRADGTLMPETLWDQIKWLEEE